MLSADAVNIKNFVGGTQKPQRSFFMKTKRFFLFGLPAVLLALGLVLAGCDDGSGSGGGGGGGGSLDSALVATWHSTQTAADSGESAVFEFKTGGVLVMAGQADGSDFTVTTSGGRISATVTTGGQTVDGGSIAYVVNGTRLKFSDPVNGPVATVLMGCQDLVDALASDGNGYLYKSSSSNGNGNGNGTGGGGNLPAIDETTTTGQQTISKTGITVTGEGMPQTLSLQTGSHGVTFSISGGKFSFTLPQTPSNTSAMSSMDLPEGAPQITLTPNDAQFAMVDSFDWSGGSISRAVEDTDIETYMDMTQILYVYVNKNVRMTSSEKTDTDTQGDYTYNSKWKAMDFTLQMGWNLVQMYIHMTASGNTFTEETTMGIATKNVPWVFEGGK
jgi:hypothetical protein